MGITSSARIQQLYYGLDSKIVVLQLSKPFTRRKLSEIYTNILELSTVLVGPSIRSKLELSDISNTSVKEKGAKKLWFVVHLLCQPTTFQYAHHQHEIQDASPTHWY